MGRPANRWVVVGLGNPGRAYARSRHNAGAMAVETLSERITAPLKRHKSGCLVGEARLKTEKVVVARTTSYMNESGRPVAALLRWYKVDPSKLIVIHDELDIPFGQVRVKVGGGTAGHNGLASLVSHLGSRDFVRVRIGISRPRGVRDTVDYVLAEFSAAERKELPLVLEAASDAVERIVALGPERAMNEINTRPT